MNIALPLKALGLLVALSLAGTAAVRWGGVSPQQQADAATLRALQLRFEDGSAGQLQVREAGSGRLLYTAAQPGADGFLRSTVRGLVRERKRRGLGDAQPFQLLARADGRLTLFDPATTRRIELEAFGRANAQAFARLFPE
jgi:putative photosynthetic complex assembly protein